MHTQIDPVHRLGLRVLIRERVKLRGRCRSWPVERRFLAAWLVEASWEVIENTPMIIDRYRATTAALGYSGDSLLNSMSDILMMCVGFLAARKLPVWASLLLLIALELVPLFVIRDNLTLNIWTLLAPDKAIQTSSPCVRGAPDGWL